MNNKSMCKHIFLVPSSKKISNGLLKVCHLTALVVLTGGAHAGKWPSQPHEQPHSATHPTSPGCTKRTPQHRADPARSRHGCQLCGKRKHDFDCPLLGTEERLCASASLTVAARGILFFLSQSISA